MSRAVWKHKEIIKGLDFSIRKKTQKNTIETYSKARKKQISIHDVNKSLLVYNGQNHVLIKINENMVGYKLGEFVMTRKRYISKKKKKNK